MICHRCSGTGYEEYEEDGRIVGDACYHCGKTGEIDEEQHWQDQLASVATTLAINEEREYRKSCNENPDGEGYDFCAAENMMTSYDYFQVRVWDRERAIMEKLLSLPLADKELLVAWNEMPYELPIQKNVLLIDEFQRCSPEVQADCLKIVEFSFLSKKDNP